MRLSLALAAALALAGCTGSDPPPAENAGDERPRAGAMAATSAAFAHNAPIPARHTCDDANVSPPLTVTGVPANASTLALVVYDPDAPFPQAPLRNITHWVLYNIPAGNGTVRFPEDSVPAGSVEGENGTGYRGPCPPAGSPAHRYVFTFHAVEGALNLPAGAPRADVEAALADAAIARATLVGTYARAVPPT